MVYLLVRQLRTTLILFAAVASCLVQAFFVLNTRTNGRRTTGRSTSRSIWSSSNWILKAVSKTTTIQQTEDQKSRRKELLRRNGPYFKLDRFTGEIEFGVATNLVTDISKHNPNVDKASIEEWLLDSRELALSIWDEKLLEELGNSVYRLQTMPVQFLTLFLQPTVDLQMWTQPSGKNRAGRLLPPIFKLQSIGFETNLRLMPGLGITSSDDLGVLVEVAGDLRPTEDGQGVTGKISFQTKGLLPPPLRVLPDSALQLATQTVNNAISQFAIGYFEKGAVQKYNDFMKQKEKNRTESQAATE